MASARAMPPLPSTTDASSTSTTRPISIAFDAATGRQLWDLSIGTVQKGSPVWADGKLYVGEVDGKFYILQPGENEGKILDQDEFLNPDGSAVQINGSPAIDQRADLFVNPQCALLHQTQGKEGRARPASCRLLGRKTA